MTCCPKCQSDSCAKSGFVQGKQRYKCKNCGCNYRYSTRSRIPPEQRDLAMGLYREGVSLRGIERLTGISHVTVMRWVREADRQDCHCEKDDPSNHYLMNAQQFSGFLAEKNKNCRCGWRIDMVPDETVPAGFVGVNMPVAEK